VCPAISFDFQFLILLFVIIFFATLGASSDGVESERNSGDQAAEFGRGKSEDIGSVKRTVFDLVDIASGCSVYSADHWKSRSYWRIGFHFQHLSLKTMEKSF